MKKCFGIISWLPNDQSARRQRGARINRLLKQLESLWPDIDILIIAQNWKNFKMYSPANKVTKINFTDGLGILKARQTLNEEFLKLDYDYIILLDDDAIIETTPEASRAFIQEIDNHKDGFAFVKKEKPTDPNYPYKLASLNLAVLSRYILENEPLPELDPQNGQAFEDVVYPALLHTKWAKNEFSLPVGITHTQFNNKNEKIPSTWNAPGQWANDDRKILFTNSDKLCAYITANKDLPDLSLFYEYGVLVSKGASKNKWYVQQLKAQLKKKKEDRPYLYF